MKRITALFALALAVTLPVAAPAQAEDPLDWSEPDRELRVAVEGGEIWVRVNGDLEAEAEPAIFIHGGPGGTHTVFGYMTSLADSRAVILYDQLDSGKSDHPQDEANWRVERFVAELEAIRKALGIERWHLIGHSWGAALALEYGAAYPEHTASAVLAGTYISTPHWIMGTNLLIRELPDETARTLIACEGDDPPSPASCASATRAFYAAYNGRADQPPPSAKARAYQRKFRGRGFNAKLYNGMWGPSEFSVSGSLIDYDATPLLARIDGSRVLYMVGQYDEARIDDVQNFVRLTEGSELAVVPGGSHGFPIERPEVTEAILRDWMARIDGRERLARIEQRDASK